MSISKKVGKKGRIFNLVENKQYLIGSCIYVKQ